MDEQQKMDEIVKAAMNILSKPGADIIDPNRPFLDEKDNLFGNVGTFELTPGFRLRDAFDILIAIKACNRLMSDTDLSDKDKVMYSEIYAGLMSGKLPKSKINLLQLIEQDNTFAFDVLTTSHDVFALYAASIINHPSHKEQS